MKLESDFQLLENLGIFFSELLLIEISYLKGKIVKKYLIKNFFCKDYLIKEYFL